MRWLLAGVTHLRYTVLTSSNKSETAVHSCDPALSVLVMLVSRNVFPVVSALQSIAFIHIFGLIRSLEDPTLAAFIVCGPLHLVTYIRSFKNTIAGTEKLNLNSNLVIFKAFEQLFDPGRRGLEQKYISRFYFISCSEKTIIQSLKYTKQSVNIEVSAFLYVEM